MKQARTAAQGALDWSALAVPRRSAFKGPRTAVVLALAPFLAFLGVSAAGIWVPLNNVSIAVAVAILIGVSGISAILAGRRRIRGVLIGGLGIGASLSVFFALYLIAYWADPWTISMDHTPVARLGEAGLLSLTISVTAGTLGIDLNGSARVIAFIQVLLSVGALLVAARWSWLYVIDRLPRPKPEPDEG